MVNTAGHCDPPLSFGIEIERVVLPRKYRPYEVQHYEALARRLTGCYDIRADWNRRNRRKGTDYNVWYITRDGSLKAEDHEVALEAVSRKLEVSSCWEKEIEAFWTAMDDLFWLCPALSESNLSCGSHIHVAPTSRRFTLWELKQIALATIIHEDHILTILPDFRRNNKYCMPNSSVQETQLWDDYGWLKSEDGLIECRKRIRSFKSTAELVRYMQGKERKVLWNFNNTLHNGSGTVEFRGGRFLSDAESTKSWATFAFLFIDRALRSNYLYEYYELTWTSLNWRNQTEFLAERDDLWDDLRSMANYQHMPYNLPATVYGMSEEEESEEEDSSEEYDVYDDSEDSEDEDQYYVY
ncbi:hypothetical protein N431DRAFT_423562 [Stipitochalara longipes BDJ]|nr:hypothetical protein N431DRAFT_423562 [Stipitochalara longipes BDJ]